MTKNELTAYWLAEAEESLIVTGDLFDKKDYSYSLFFGQLAVENLLKAVTSIMIDNAVMTNIAAFLERLKAAGMQLCSPEKLMRNGK